jgi:23S rRNA maturation mini-RNase III
MMKLGELKRLFQDLEKAERELDTRRTANGSSLWNAKNSEEADYQRQRLLEASLRVMELKAKEI